MSYSITFSTLSIKQLKKLPKDIQLRILSVLERCRIRPYPHVKKLVASPYYRLRVGEYRIIIDILESQIRIHVIEIGHRKNIYK